MSQGVNCGSDPDAAVAGCGCLVFVVALAAAVAWAVWRLASGW